MSSGKRRKKVLDGEQLFNYYYIEMGDARSYNKLTRWASEKWGKNPETNRDWTSSAVWQAAWRWAFDHLDYAKDMYEKATAVTRNHAPMSDDEWYESLSQYARSCMTKGQYQRFLNKHSYLKPYEVLRK